MNKSFFLLCFFFLQVSVYAQKQKADSLETLLAKTKADTSRVKLMWQIAGVINVYDPGRALILSQQALFLADKIKYAEGQSKSLGALANTFIKLGNYPKALEYNLQKLQLEEKRENPHNLASVLMNIGIVYNYQEEYQQALLYYRQSDSVIDQYNIKDLKHYSTLALGDVYDRLGNSDSAFSYYNRTLVIANNIRDEDFIGSAMVGLGNVYRKQENYPFALLNYRTAIAYLRNANDDDLFCEATLDLAKLFNEQNKNDSTVYYAYLSLSTAQQDGFMAKELDATQFLSDHYKKRNNIDSAYVYLNQVKALNDSINSRTKIREVQIISSNEQLRQLEMEENKKTAQRERRQQLQYLLIGIFIPGFFLLTLLLSRIRIHSRVIKILGILSLLMLFEYLTLLLHPYVAVLTNHTPIYEMFIFVSIAALLIPGHHRVERWLIEKLTHVKDGSIRLKKVKLKVKKPSD